MKELAILNFKINIGDWPKGPFSDIYELKSAYKKIIDLEPFLGDFMCLNSGELIRGHEKGLCTRVGVVDIGEAEFPQGGDYIIHWKSKKGSATNGLFKKEERLFMRDYLTGYKNDFFELYPIYTLEGLYNILPDKRYATKRDAIRDELKKHGCSEELKDFDNHRPKDRRKLLPLLENLYKKEISDQ